jgi:hypothetical protein
MTSTQQSEALQAVRLLRGAALSQHSEPKTQAYIESLYQACKLLEGFIANSGKSDCGEVYSPDVRCYNNKRFAAGEYVRTRIADDLVIAKIVDIDERGLWLEVGTARIHNDIWDVHYRNQTGSFKK